MLLSEKKLLKTLNGQATWPPPIWLMRQAGRFLPEFKALREQADFLTRCLTPDLAVEITLQPIRRFGMDAAILFSDILILPWAMGQDLQFIEGKGPILTPIRSRADLSKLHSEKVQEKTFPVLESLQRLNKILNKDGNIGLAPSKSVGLIGFTGSPFTVACYMIEGRSSVEFSTVFKMIYQEETLFQAIIDLLVESTASYLSRQITAGAEVVMLFDSWAGLLPFNFFKKYVIAPTRQIVQIIKDNHPTCPIIGFPRLAGSALFSYVNETKVHCVGLDSKVDLAFIDQAIDPKIGFQGNLDPLQLVYGGKAMQKEVTSICQQLSQRPHIFNLGHGVFPNTPVDHVYQLIEILRNLKLKT